MFKKIVSNLPFSPALVGQIGFYAKRLRGEELTRRLGLFFVALALIVQSFAVFQPAESANASSDADMITGGATTLSELLNVYDNNTKYFKDIMTYVGITRDEIAASSFESFNVGERLTWGMVPHYSYADGEREFNITNSSGQTVTQVYSRPLKLGVGTTNASRTGWVGYSKKLGWFAIRDKCGNLISEVNPEPPERCAYNPALLAEDNNCKPCQYDASLWINDPLCKEPIIDTPEKCTFNPNILATDNDCKPCQYDSTLWINSHLCVKPPEKCRYNPDLLATDKNCLPCQYDHSLWINSPKCVAPVDDTPVKCSVNPNILASDPNCLSCPGNETIWINEESCKPNIVMSKTAINISQDSVNASSVTAKVSDLISYTILIENTGLNTTSSIKLDEQISDLLEYSILKDNGGGTLNEKTGVLSWPDISLDSNTEQTRTFVVKVLDVIPATAQGVSNDTSYDCLMTNTFGNSININVDCPTPKIVEQIVTNLPVTGPKENILFAGIVLSIATYFYARARQQGKEIRLIRKDISTGTL